MNDYLERCFELTVDESKLGESNAITLNRSSAEVNEQRRQLHQLTPATPGTQLIFNKPLTDGFLKIQPLQRPFSVIGCFSSHLHQGG